MSTVRDRAFNILNTVQYARVNRPDRVGKNEILEVPDGDFYVLRMLIKKPFEDFKIPEELAWVEPLVLQAHFYQQNIIGVKHPFCYLTIRKGKVKSVTDDEWHVDGFSQTITHLPEQNYIWTDVNPTEYIKNYPITIPRDFNSAKHNIHRFLQKEISEAKGNVPIEVMEPETLYCLDPYIIHRRPPITKGTERTFIRISFCPIEIADVNNTLNPLIPTNYTRDGVKEMRNKLVDYAPNKRPIKVFLKKPGKNLEV